MDATETQTRATDLLTRSEIASLTARSNLAGAWAIASTWAIIAATFAALARWPNAIVFAIAVVVLGGRQLALAVLVHEGAHRTLFRARFLNDVAADWLAGRIMGSDVARYREHHLRHHALTGTEDDPDKSLTASFPTRRASLARKLLRDLFGLTGLKRVVGLFLVDIGVLEYTVSAEVKRRPRAGRSWLDYAREGAKNLAGPVVLNAILAGVLAATGHAWLFAAWVVAYLTTFSLFLRVRSFAEHACKERVIDILRNTRTTRAGWLARATVAPFGVNFHLEHHLLMAVPYHRLPRMHRLLLARGAIPEPPTYLGVLGIVTRSERHQRVSA